VTPLSFRKTTVENGNGSIAAAQQICIQQQSTPIAAAPFFRPRDVRSAQIELTDAKTSNTDPGCFIQDVTTGHPSTSRIHP
jgi:hypothetical protein